MRTIFLDEHFVEARMSSASTTLFNENDFTTVSDTSVPASRGVSTNQSSYPMMIKFIHDSIQGMDLLDLDYEQYDNSDEDFHQSMQIPTMASVLKRDFRKKRHCLRSHAKNHL